MMIEEDEMFRTGLQDNQKGQNVEQNKAKKKKVIHAINVDGSNEFGSEIDP